jgi:multidrug resistance efflux pump
MSVEDRILRLENALATLAELSADHERRAADHERRTADYERRASRLEESFLMLVELARSHNESIDELRVAQAELSTAQAGTEHKLAALVDAHIRTEDALARLTEKVNDILQSGRNGNSSS